MSVCAFVLILLIYDMYSLYFVISSNLMPLENAQSRLYQFYHFAFSRRGQHGIRHSR